MREGPGTRGGGMGGVGARDVGVRAARCARASREGHALLFRVAWLFFSRACDGNRFVAWRSMATAAAVRSRRFALSTRIVDGEKISTTT